MNYSTSSQAPTKKQSQHGLSLIELMVSMVIGLLILAALTTLFINQNKTRNELDKSNRMIDNGRYALELLSENLSLAGYYGEYGPSGVPSSTPAPCTLATIVDASANLNVLLHHVQGYDAASEADAVASPPCGISTKTGSDILVMRRVSTASVTEASVATAASLGVVSTPYMQVSNCTTDVPPSYKIALGSTGFTTLHKKNCTASGAGVGDGLSDLRPFMVEVYFVSPDNVAGDGIPTLKRVELDATGSFVTTPLVEGIEFMQVDYGLDANADGAADSYIAAPVTENWPNIVSVKINIISRNIETTTGYVDGKTYELGNAGTFGPFSDAYKRHAYTQVVRLVNPSSRREAP